MNNRTRTYYAKALNYQSKADDNMNLALKSLLLEKGVSEDFADRFSISLLHGAEDVIFMDGEAFIQGLDLNQLDEMTKEEIYDLIPDEPHIRCFN